MFGNFSESEQESWSQMQKQSQKNVTRLMS